MINIPRVTKSIGVKALTCSSLRVSSRTDRDSMALYVMWLGKYIVSIQLKNFMSTNKGQRNTGAMCWALLVRGGHVKRGFLVDARSDVEWDEIMTISSGSLRDDTVSRSCR